MSVTGRRTKENHQPCSGFLLKLLVKLDLIGDGHQNYQQQVVFSFSHCSFI